MRQQPIGLGPNWEPELFEWTRSFSENDEIHVYDLMSAYPTFTKMLGSGSEGHVSEVKDGHGRSFVLKVGKTRTNRAELSVVSHAARPEHAAEAYVYALLMNRFFGERDSLRDLVENTHALPFGKVYDYALLNVADDKRGKKMVYFRKIFHRPVNFYPDPCFADNVWSVMIMENADISLARWIEETFTVQNPWGALDVVRLEAYLAHVLMGLLVMGDRMRFSHNDLIAENAMLFRVPQTHVQIDKNDFSVPWPGDRYVRVPCLNGLMCKLVDMGDAHLEARGGIGAASEWTVLASGSQRVSYRDKGLPGAVLQYNPTRDIYTLAMSTFSKIPPRALLRPAMRDVVLLLLDMMSAKPKYDGPKVALRQADVIVADREARMFAESAASAAYHALVREREQAERYLETVRGYKDVASLLFEVAVTDMDNLSEDYPAFSKMLERVTKSQRWALMGWVHGFLSDELLADLATPAKVLATSDGFKKWRIRGPGRPAIDADSAAIDMFTQRVFGTLKQQPPHAEQQGDGDSDGESDGDGDGAGADTRGRKRTGTRGDLEDFSKGDVSGRELQQQTLRRRTAEKKPPPPTTQVSPASSDTQPAVSPHKKTPSSSAYADLSPQKTPPGYEDLSSSGSYDSEYMSSQMIGLRADMSPTLHPIVSGTLGLAAVYHTRDADFVADHYPLFESPPIGSGSFGVVFRATDPHGTRVAIKLQLVDATTRTEMAEKLSDMARETQVMDLLTRGFAPTGASRAETAAFHGPVVGLYDYGVLFVVAGAEHGWESMQPGAKRSLNALRAHTWLRPTTTFGARPRMYWAMVTQLADYTLDDFVEDQIGKLAGTDPVADRRREDALLQVSAAVLLSVAVLRDSAAFTHYDLKPDNVGLFDATASGKSGVVARLRDGAEYYVPFLAVGQKRMAARLLDLGLAHAHVQCGAKEASVRLTDDIAWSATSGPLPRGLTAAPNDTYDMQRFVCSILWKQSTAHKVFQYAPRLVSLMRAMLSSGPAYETRLIAREEADREALRASLLDVRRPERFAQSPLLREEILESDWHYVVASKRVTAANRHATLVNALGKIESRGYGKPRSAAWHRAVESARAIFTEPFWNVEGAPTPEGVLAAFPDFAAYKTSTGTQNLASAQRWEFRLCDTLTPAAPASASLSLSPSGTPPIPSSSSSSSLSSLAERTESLSLAGSLKRKPGTTQRLPQAHAASASTTMPARRETMLVSLDPAGSPRKATVAHQTPAPADAMDISPIAPAQKRALVSPGTTLRSAAVSAADYVRTPTQQQKRRWLYTDEKLPPTLPESFPDTS